MDDKQSKDAIDAVIDAFGASGSTVSLPWLSSLTPALAHAIVKTPESVRVVELPMIAEISEVAAEALSSASRGVPREHPVSILLLSGLTGLTVTAATHLAKFRGLFCLYGSSLSPSAAALLQKNAFGIDFGHLTTLSADDAQIVSRIDGPLNLSGLATLSVEAARQLATHSPGPLYLDRLSSLPPGVADALRAHNGPLSLNGLRELSYHDASQFSQHRDELSLNGLEYVSQPCADLLAKRKFGTSLKGIRGVPIEVSRILAGLRSVREFRDPPQSHGACQLGDSLWCIPVTIQEQIIMLTFSLKT